MKKLLISLVLIVFITCTAFAKTGKITLYIDGFRSDKGVVKIGLFSSKEGFPDQPQKAFKSLISQINNRKSEAIFADIPFGTYAIGILHDENLNNKMDTKFFGIPQEGFGASNDAKGLFGPPSFNDAKFVLDSTNCNLNIKVQY
ncbi:hypothetical protein A2526_02895 [candidate division WOR-1 bacterium RIFOXYD2_FULL_36_8]|uniref:DUF2141 domain-containing protein n=1 Tax=candidate division WOR-1 bacterium RIFOXYB2_FULL_36_35 TaxID=1802578 RepID=A0A1F4RZG5_UNCSA|nr:MAG: hypothetical protein A2290_08080 [candidate division WOR-1 bacterium RIFOXYB2_FULL_36_35]OGC16493.1 MAG: hypothetical protein A2282_02025 [candidate division WOR-1 bacterium RIFOXYA12_FULL_36_13]OGC37550.1 MAG: hypothetical protein A2526_02895 [candidate division WOR-1 bacterium RIFOXYD2_FULL_36_8]